MLDVARETATGDSIMLRVEATPAVLAAVGDEAKVIVTVDGESASYALTSLTAGVTVYRFKTAKPVGVDYALTRNIRHNLSVGEFRLIQTLGSGSANLSFRPWVASEGQHDLLAPAGCVISQFFQLVCGDTVSVSPFYAPPENIGGTFTSQSGTGASVAVSVTFSKAIRLFTAKIYDPTFAGNGMVAYDSAGNQLGSISFAFSGQPGQNVPDEQTIAFRGIRRVDLVPASQPDYVAYDASFELDTCPTTGDSVLDSPSVQNALRSALSLSNPDSTPGTGVKMERAGIIYQRPDGSIVAYVVTDPAFFTASECFVEVHPDDSPPESGLAAIAEFHTHPSSNNEAIYGCRSGPNQPPLAQTRGDGLPVPHAEPDSLGGGSSPDWRRATSTTFPDWVINKDGRVYKLTPGTPMQQWNNNPNKWEWKNSGVPGCMSHIS